MTERQQDKDLLADLLYLPSAESATAANECSGSPAIPAEPLLTPGEERTLLREANRAEPPTLAPEEDRLAQANPASFAMEVAEVVRRHPIPTILLSAGLAYLLTHRRR